MLEGLPCRELRLHRLLKGARLLLLRPLLMQSLGGSHELLLLLLLLLSLGLLLGQQQLQLLRKQQLGLDEGLLRLLRRGCLQKAARPARPLRC